MDLIKALKWQMIHGSLMGRLIVKVVLFASAILVVSFTHMAYEARYVKTLAFNVDECQLNFGLNPYKYITGSVKTLPGLMFPILRRRPSMPNEESKNLSKNMFTELMTKGLLETNAKALCVGKGSNSAALALRELGVSNALRVNSHPSFSLSGRRFVYDLGFKDNSFDFVFSRALDRISFPALLVLEIERVLRPGGVGAMLVGSGNFYSGSMISSATPVSSFLNDSDIVHICGIGSFNLVVFRKRFVNAAPFEHFQLPDDCPSIASSKPYMKYIEPLLNDESGQISREVSYLPKYMNISSRDRLIYINVGAGDFANLNISKLIKLYYPIQPQAFNLFMVDHNTSVLSTHVKYPGITFVYHPGLAGNNAASDFNSDQHISAPLDEGHFNFVSWFNETVEDGDFVVLRMNAGAEELNILRELLKTGAICRVDELFLRCTDQPADCKGGLCGNCMSIFTSLRRSGLFVHQWTRD